jgi:hypothetical protein
MEALPSSALTANMCEQQYMQMRMAVAWQFAPIQLAARAKKYQGDAQGLLRYSAGSRNSVSANNADFGYKADMSNKSLFADSR